MSKIFYHHIGGRNGTYPLPINSKIRKYFSIVLYDADESCVQQMESRVLSDDRVIPALITDKSDNISFNLTFHPSGSSTYHFNEYYKNYTSVHYPRYGEFVIGEALKIKKTINFKSSTLPEAVSQYDIKIDFLSLDVQGAEFDILKSSEELLKKEILGVVLEVEFVELYKDQKIFTYIHDLMVRNGFSLIDINSMGKLDIRSLPIGFRGWGDIIHADFVYIKSVQEIKKNFSYKKAFKCAFFALLYANFGVCIELLEYFKNDLPRESSCLYVRILDKILQAHEHDAVYLPKFHELFTEDMVNAFYSLDKVDIDTAQKDQIKSSFREKYLPHLSAAEKLLVQDVTEIEKILNDYDFGDIAQILKKNRPRDAQIFVDLCKDNCD